MFYCLIKFIVAGVAEYAKYGKILITKETLDKFIQTIIGCPVIIQHKDITKDNANKERVGVVSDVWFDDTDGWYYCSGIIWDEKALDLIINKGWSVSCTYDFESDNTKKTYNGQEITQEFTNGKFLHLAIVPDPRYERANIVFNAKDKEFITVGEGESKRPIPVKFLEKNNTLTDEEIGDKLVELDRLAFRALAETDEEKYGKIKKQYYKLLREYQQRRGNRLMELEKRLSEKEETETFKPFVNAFGEVTTRSITSPSYEKAQKKTKRLFLK